MKKKNKKNQILYQEKKSKMKLLNKIQRKIIVKYVQKYIL